MAQVQKHRIAASNGRKLWTQVPVVQVHVPLPPFLSTTYFFYF
jgi:hypothetical protein